MTLVSRNRNHWRRQLLEKKTGLVWNRRNMEVQSTVMQLAGGQHVDLVATMMHSDMCLFPGVSGETVPPAWWYMRICGGSSVLDPSWESIRARLVTCIVFGHFAYLTQLGLAENMQAKNQHLHVDWLPASPLACMCRNGRHVVWLWPGLSLNTSPVVWLHPGQ
jgi:hypothetical protein